MSAAAPFQEASPSAPKADQVTQPQLQGSDQEEPPSYEACVSQFNHEPTGRVDINISMKKTPRSKAKITKLVASVVVKLLGSKFEFPETNQHTIIHLNQYILQYRKETKSVVLHVLESFN
jgi:hypothetical protein